MSHHCVFLSIFLTVFFLQISFLHCSPVNSGIDNHLFDDNDDTQRTQTTLLYLIRNVLGEPNPYEQAQLLNQLRQYLNRICTAGYLGSSHAHGCQHILDVVRYYDENQDKQINENANSEHHGIQKRFFCNGFIGCKNAGR